MVTMMIVDVCAASLVGDDTYILSAVNSHAWTLSLMRCVVVLLVYLVKEKVQIFMCALCTRVGVYVCVHEYICISV